jgi:carboxypeptidase T
MKNPAISFFVLLLMVDASAEAQEKFSRVKVFGDSANPYQQQAFIYGALQVDHCHFEDDAYVVEIGAAEMAQLKASAYKYRVLVDDIAEHFRLNNDVSSFYESDRRDQRLAFSSPCTQVANIITTPLDFTPGSMGGYYTYAEMVAKIGALAAAYPSIVDTFSIGRTIEGRDIWCIKISDNAAADENEAEVLFHGLQHAREAISGTSLIFFAQYLAENYARNNSVRQLVNNRELFIIPCVNADGYVYNQTTNPAGGGNWRKNRRQLGGGQFGVDLNRNYNADWGNCSAPVAGIAASCGSGVASTANNTYWGTAPFSEPETRAIRDFTAARNFRMSIDQHSEGAYNTLPHGRVSLHPTHNLIDSQFLYGFASSAMATYNCHRLGNNLQTLNYEVAGGNKDWMFQGDTSMRINPRKIYSFTSEAGGGSFWPMASQIIPLAKGLTFQYLQAALVAGAYADVQDAGDAAITSISGNLAFTVRRVGILDGPITVALVPLQNMSDAGTAITLPAGTLPNYYNTTSGNISYSLPIGLGVGQVVKFIWRVTAGGISTDDTISKIYNPVTVVYDDMETGLATSRWTISSGWGYTAAGMGLNGAGRSLAESPVGSYTSGSTRTLTYRTAINLSDATAAYLSFWVRHRSENCQDILRIRISTNGGATYTNLCGKLTIAERTGTLAGEPALTGIREEWSKELIDLSNYTGSGMNNIRLQFQFVSNTDPSNTVDPYYRKRDDGFFLDNIQLIKTTARLILLPVAFLSFEGKIVGDGKVELKWNTTINDQHDYFEVQRSVDGLQFITIGQVGTAPPCMFMDTAALPGVNYYRIKQVDKNGSFAYSTVIRVQYAKNKLSYSLYPNPAHDVVKLYVTGSKDEQLRVVLSDLSGRRLAEQNVVVQPSATELKLSLAAYPAQVLVLSIFDAKGGLLATEKLVKY